MIYGMNSPVTQVAAAKIICRMALPVSSRSIMTMPTISSINILFRTIFDIPSYTYGYAFPANTNRTTCSRYRIMICTCRLFKKSTSEQIKWMVNISFN